MAISLCFGGLTYFIPQAAAFSDITDKTTSEAASVLESMGIVSGYGNGYYYPDNYLTRAQFCKLAVLALGLSSSSALSTDPFSDVSSSYWARSYINLAYSKSLISGYGNGIFGPENTVTYGQAVTVLLRLLGYTSTDIGNFWPDDYVSFAEEIGLSDGVTSSADKPLTRGEAAILLANMFSTENSDSKLYYEAYAASTVEAVVLSNDATTDDGTTDQVKICADSVSYYSQSVALPDVFVGRKGTILLNKNEEVCGFIPDTTKYKDVTIETVTATTITDSDEKEYKASSDAEIIYDDSVYDYASYYYLLEDKGTVRLFYSEAGTIETIYVASASNAEALVAETSFDSSTNPFEKTLGLSSGGYTLFKNGVKADISEIAKYDVATYDSITKSLMVSDFKLSGFYEDAYPNAETPSTITVMGTTFDVLDSAHAYLSKLSVGDKITLLFTADGKVAAAYSVGSLKAQDAIGVLTSADTDATVTLLNGTTITAEISDDQTNATDLVGELVEINQDADFTVKVTRLLYFNGTKDLDLSTSTLGKILLSSDLKIYDRAGSCSVAEIDIEELPLTTISSSSIIYYETNSAGYIDLIVLSDVTGDGYTYGFFTTVIKSTSSKNMSASNYSITVKNGDGSTTLLSGESINMSIGGVAATGGGSVSAVSTLNKVTSISRTAFDGTDSVVVNGTSIAISDNVQVYNADTEQWTTLEKALLFTDTFTVYYDKTIDTGKVRIIVTE